MIRNHILLAMILFSIKFTAQVETKYFTDKNSLEILSFTGKDLQSKTTRNLPSFDIEKLVMEDREVSGLDVPYRFGKGFDTDFTLADGSWDDTPGGRFWSMSFHSKGALSLNFVFNDFFLPKGAELYIANEEKTMLYGPVLNENNTKEGYFLTDLVEGDKVTVYLYEPEEQKGESKLTIKRIVHAYRNNSEMTNGNLGASEGCNNNVDCFQARDLESDAVALILLANGTEWCSGSLLMTSDQSYRPYFLSAFHCIDIETKDGTVSPNELSSAQNWLFKFQYKTTSCTSTSATAGVTYNGAMFRAGWDVTDFLLMEMASSPLGNNAISWLGWDRSVNTPTSGYGIHHPAGDVMKISFENNPFQITSWGGVDSHWRVSFDDGVVQHGSSGSPILNQNNRVVGQLHGNRTYWGGPYCNSPIGEYGRFNLSWAGGGTPATRLSNWLNPCGTIVTTTNTNRSPIISGPPLVCSSATYSVNSPAGSTVSWSRTPSSAGSLSSGSGTSTIFTATNGFNGTVSITATMASAGCGQITGLTRQFHVGKPNVPSTLSGPSQVLTGALVNYNSSVAPGATEYEWRLPFPFDVIPGSWNINSSRWQMRPTTSRNLTAFTGTGRISGLVQVMGKNACGVGGARTKSVSHSTGGGGGIPFTANLSDFGEVPIEDSVYPNPSDTDFNIYLVDRDSYNYISTTLITIDGKVIFNSENRNLTNIPTANLPNGNYILSIVTNKGKTTKNIVVKH
jgi:lysyl endopeptidase